MHWIDTHIHIYASEFDADRNQVIEHALQAGVRQLLMPNVDASSYDAMMLLAEQYSGVCYPMAALHPTSVKQDFAQEIALVEKALQSGKQIAVGETGIDLYWDKTYYQQQVKAFKIQIAFAIKYNLPLVIHSRNALDEIFEAMGDFSSQNLRGVFHCFPGDVAQAKKVLDMGFLIGVGGVVTYKNGNLQPVVEYAGVENIILETDAPYLAPAPYRGKRNEPAYIEIIGGKVAQILNKPLDTIAQITTHNAQVLFGLPKFTSQNHSHA